MDENSFGTSEISTCSICQKFISGEESSVSCSGLCGKRQHVSCLNFIDDTNIIWKCNDCLNKTENLNILDVSKEFLEPLSVEIENENILDVSKEFLEPLSVEIENGNILDVSKEFLEPLSVEIENENILGVSKEFPEPIEDVSLQIEENNEIIGYSDNFPLASSPQLKENSYSESSSIKSNSKVILADKHENENVNLNEISIDGEVADPLMSPCKGEKILDKYEDGVNDNLNEISENGIVADPLTPSIKRQKISDKHDENVILNEISVDEDVVNPSTPSCKRQKKFDVSSGSPRELPSVSINYIMLDKISKNNKPKLFDSLGYSYMIRYQTKNATIWQCGKLIEKKRCKGKVEQINNKFIHLHKHEHLGDLECYVSAQKTKKERSSQKNVKLHQSVNSKRIVTCKNVKNKIKRPKTVYLPKRVKSRKNVKRIEKLKKSQSKKNETELQEKVDSLQETHKVEKNENKVKNIDEGISSQKLIEPIKKKSVYILLQNEKDGSQSKLFDQTLGFTYNLYKKMERTKVWLCTKSESEYKCEAAVKQVGNYFIRSRKVHNHNNHNKHSPLLQEKLNNKAKIKSRTSGNSSDITSINEKSLEDSSQNILKQNLKKEENPLHGIGRPRSEYGAYKHIISVQSKMSDKSLKRSVKRSKNIEKIDVDRDILNILESLHNVGAYLTNEVIIENIQEYIDKQNFDINVNRTWVSTFCKKYEKQLGGKHIKKSAYKNLISISLVRVNSFFRDLEKLLNLHDIEIRDLLSQSNSNRVFNCDVMNIIVKGLSKTTKAKDESDNPFHVVCCINASGQSTKPVIINKGKKIISYKTAKDIKGSFNSVCSSTGQFSRDMFLTWLSEDFIQYLIENNIETPVLLLVNGANIHISWDSLSFANNNGIILFQFPLFKIKALQPLCGILQTILKIYKNLQDKLSCNSRELCTVFPTIFMKAYNQVDIAQLSKETFKSTGICPVDEMKLTFAKYPEVKPAVKESDALPKITEEIIPVNDSSDSESCISDGNAVNSSALDSPDEEERSFSNVPIDKVEKVLKIQSVSSKTDLQLDGESPEKPKNSFKTPIKNKSLNGAKELNIDKLSLKIGYKLALSNMEKIFSAVLEPATIEMFQRKLEANEELYDTNFVVWKGLQELKQIPDLFGNS